MRVVFMGTPTCAATVLKALAGRHDVVGVYTRPDAVRKRGNKLDPSPVAIAATELGLPVYKLANLKSSDDVDVLENLNPDVICVMAYGALLTKDVLDIAPYGCLNVHGSLLPRWRGAAPVERAILSGDENAGVCIMKMEEGLDTGDFCCKRSFETGDKSQEELMNEVAIKGSEALLEALDILSSGSNPAWAAQDEALVTYAHKIETGELDLYPEDSACVCVRKIRASSEAHPAHAQIAGKNVIVIKAHEVDKNEADEIVGSLKPGELRFARKRLILKAQGGCFEVLELKPSGKKAMDAKSFAAGVQGLKNNIANWGSCS